MIIYMLNPKFKAVYLNQDHCTALIDITNGNHFTLMKLLKLKMEEMVDRVKVMPTVEMTGRAVINIAL